MTGFADRFFWARHRAGLGAPAIAERIGCAQALINNIERGEGARSSKYNDQFAKIFAVDENWLRKGIAPIPVGYDDEEAREMRSGGPRRGAKVLSLSELAPRGPRWAEGTPAPDNDRAEALQKRIIADFHDYAHLVSTDRAKAFLEMLEHIRQLVAPVEEIHRNGH